MPDTTPKVPLPGSTRSPVTRAKLDGPSNPDQLIKVSIYAKARAKAAAARVATARDDTQLPGKRKYMDNAEFDATYGANPADLDKIATWAQSHKLDVLQRSVPKRLVLVQGTIRNVEAAFGVKLNVYTDAQGGGFRAREGQIRVPPELADIIDGVFGLDTRRVGRPRFRRAGFEKLPLEAVTHSRTRARKAKPKPKFAKDRGTFFPPDVAKLYNYPANLDGTGQNIAVFAFNGAPDGDPHGGYNLDSLKLYFEEVLGGVTPSITDVRVHGPGNEPGPDTNASGDAGDSTGEVMLDMCIVGAVAPGAKMFVYFTEFTSQGWVDALHQAITDDNDISVISISYGNPEDDPDGAWTKMGLNVVNQAFAMAGAKGITICCAAGDDGSTDAVDKAAHVDFPASSPHVLGVGGTKLVATAGPRPTIKKEVVWNEVRLDEGATGGGISAVFTKPDYQSAVTVPPNVNPPHVVGRGVPDVSAVGDPSSGLEVMHINGKHLDAIGGTSASAPLWAALVARLNQGLKARCGFLNPVLYTKCAKGVLRDITVGNNGAYVAGRGWDACTGLGSPHGMRLFKALGGKTKAKKKKAKPRSNA